MRVQNPRQTAVGAYPDAVHAVFHDAMDGVVRDAVLLCEITGLSVRNVKQPLTCADPERTAAVLTHAQDVGLLKLRILATERSEFTGLEVQSVDSAPPRSDQQPVRPVRNHRIDDIVADAARLARVRKLPDSRHLIRLRLSVQVNVKDAVAACPYPEAIFSVMDNGIDGRQIVLKRIRDSQFFHAAGFQVIIVQAFTVGAYPDFRRTSA